MMLRAALAAFLFSALFASPALAQTQPCRFTQKVEENSSLQDLPASISADLPSLMALPGETFNRPDNTTPAPRPRVTRTGHIGAIWFVWVDRGIAYSQDVYLYDATPGTEPGPFLTVTELGDMCARAEAELNRAAADSVCRYTHNVQNVALKDLPAAIRKKLPQPGEMYSTTPGEIIPDTKFLRAGRVGTHWFVWIMKTGIHGELSTPLGYPRQIRLFEQESYGFVALYPNADKILPATTLCAQSDAALDSVHWEMDSAGSPLYDCKFSPAIKEATLKDLPAALRATLPKPIADKGELFNYGDAVNPDMPDNGLIRAGHIGSRWFAWTLRGGVEYTLQMRVFDTATSRLSLQRPVRRPPICSFTDALLKAGP